MEKCCDLDSLLRGICFDGSGILSGCQRVRAPTTLDTFPRFGSASEEENVIYRRSQSII